MAVPLYAFGEELVAALLRGDGANSPICTVEGDLCEGTVADVIGRLIGAEFPRLTVEPAIGLSQFSHGGSRYSFDGMSEVDVLVSGEGAGVPIEVKLGTKGMAAVTFAKRFLGGCCCGKHESTDDVTRINGNMISVLEGGVERLLGQSPLPLEVNAP